MEQQQKGLKSILLDVLGLHPGNSDRPALAQPALDPQQQEAASTAAEAAPTAPADVVADLAAAAEEEAPDQQHNVFASRLASISQKYGSDASAARDAQQYLLEAHRQARQKELELLVAADAAYTPAWRQTGLPSKPSQLQLDQTTLSGAQLLNPGAIITRQHETQQNEVLQPPVAYAYCDKTAASHYLQATGNQKVRQIITAARLAAVKSPTQQRADTRCSRQQASTKEQPRLQSPQPQAAATSQPQQASAAAATAATAATAAKAGPGRVPWSQLPTEEAAANVAAAAARYKAMAAIMTPERRELEEKIIKRMHQRLCFLRNPRHASSRATAPATATALRGSSTAHKQHQASSKGGGSSRAGSHHPRAPADASRTPEQAGFAVMPPQGAVFDSYEPGGVYLQTVQLQNAGLVMQQLRLLPPASQYFQVSVPRFPLDSSALAPGMCAEVDVCFTPDSLGDYEDAFTVETPAGGFAVQLTGRRPYPQLTLPTVLEVGTVLAGNTRSRTFEFVNQGGDGCFLLLPAKQWAATLEQHEAQPYTPEQLASAAAASCGPFSISPAYLDLPAGAAEVLSVDFSPQQPGHQAADFVLVCDNCTANTLRVEGRGGQVQVELVGLDSRPWLPQDAQMPLWFGQACAGSSNTRRLRVRNATDLPFPFVWSVQDSQPHASTAAAAFTVTPATGVLQAACEREFEVQFSPMAVAAYGAMLSLAVQRSGDAGLLSITQWGQESTAIVDLAATRASQGGVRSSSSAAAGAAGHADAGSNQQQVAGLGSHDGCKGCVDACSAGEGVNAGPATAEWGHCSTQVQPDGAWPGGSDWECVTEVAVEGVGCPIMLSLQPAAMLRLPGALTVGDQASLALQLCNHTAAPAHYCVTAAVGPDAAPAAAHVAIEPCAGVVPANSVLDLAAHFTALSAGSHLQHFVVKVLHGQDLHLQAHVEVLQVKVVPSCPTLDFGVLCVGSSATQALQLSSTAAHSSCTWSLQELDCQECMPCTELQVQPSRGTLAPLACCSTAVTVTGRSAGSRKLLLRLSSSSGACSSCVSGMQQLPGASEAKRLQRSCSCSAECVQVMVTVSSPKVALSKYRLPLRDLYIGVPQTHSLSMTNTSSLPNAFNWAVKQLPHGQYLQLKQQLHALHQLANTTTTKHCTQPAGNSASGISGSDASAGKVCGGSTRPAQTALACSNTELEQRPPAAGQVLLSIAPNTGQLQPGQSVKLQLRLQPLAVGPVALLCCCQVPAMSQLVGLLITGEVGGLQVSHQILTPEELLVLQQQQQQLQVRRNSSPAGRHSSSPSRGASAASSAPRAGRLRASFAVDSSHGSAVAQPPAAVAAPADTAQALAQAPGGAAAVSGGTARPLAADFGVVQLHQPAELLLRVTNLTSIPSMVTAWMGHFAAAAQAAPQAPASPTAAAAAAPFLAGHADGHHRPGMWVHGGTDAGSVPAAKQQGGAYRSPVHSAASQGGGSTSRSSSPCSQALSGHGRQVLSATRKGRVGSPAQLSAASLAAKLSWTDPGSFTGSRLDGGAPIHADALITTLTSISKQGAAGAFVVESSSGVSAFTSSSSSSSHGVNSTGSHSLCTTTSSSSSGSGGLKGPFRAFAGNAMMAARQAAAAAAAALGTGAAGCAVQLLPDAVELPGWGSCLLRLQAFNNLPGSYFDTLYVQVGELPPQRIPVALKVEGSPLVISKQRVQVQGSEVLHTLLHQQQRPLLLPSRQPLRLPVAAACCGGSADASGDASHGKGSDNNNHSQLSGAATGSSGATGSVEGSIASTQRSVRTDVRLDFGVVPAGVEVQHTLFVSNTGAMPMRLEWQCAEPAAEALEAGVGCSSLGSSTASAATTGVAGVSHAGQGAEGTPASTRPASAAVEAAGAADADSASGVTGAHSSSQGSGMRTSSAGASVAAAAAAAAGVTAGAAAVGHRASAGKARAVVSAGRTEAVKGPAVHPAAAGHDGQQQQQQHQDGLDPVDAAAEVSGSVADAAPAAAAVTSVEHAATVVVESCDSLLPLGGPSSLLETLQQQQQQVVVSHHTAHAATCTTGSGGLLQSPAGPPACTEAAVKGHGTISNSSSSSRAASLFKIAPEACVIPPGQQQQLVVTFVSNDPTSMQHLVLRGKQTLCRLTGDSTAPSACGSAKDKLGLHLLLPALGSQQQAAAASTQALQCCITGGFHPHAARPPSSIPALTVNLSAQAAVPQLTPADPDCFVWTCSCAVDPRTHASYLQVATLCNTTGCPLVFGLGVVGPFRLVAVVPSVDQDLDAFRGLLGSNSVTPAGSTHHTAETLLLLPPGESAKVTLVFDPAAQPQPSSAAAPGGVRLPAPGPGLPIGLRQQQVVGQMAQTGAAQDGVLVSLGAVAKPGETQHHGSLVVTYTTGHQQVLPLRALLVQPELLVVPPTGLDFGGVHPAAPRTLQLTVTNPTEADAVWEAVVQDLSAAAATASEAQQLGQIITGAPAAFSVTPPQGTLEGRGLRMPAQCRLQVEFAPQSSGMFAAELHLKLRRGNDVVLQLRGQGVHTESAELRAGYDL